MKAWIGLLCMLLSILAAVAGMRLQWPLVGLGVAGAFFVAAVVLFIRGHLETPYEVPLCPECGKPIEEGGDIEDDEWADLMKKRE